MLFVTNSYKGSALFGGKGNVNSPSGYIVHPTFWLICTATKMHPKANQSLALSIIFLLIRSYSILHDVVLLPVSNFNCPHDYYRLPKMTVLKFWHPNFQSVIFHNKWVWFCNLTKWSYSQNHKISWVFIGVKGVHGVLYFNNGNISSLEQFVSPLENETAWTENKWRFLHKMSIFQEEINTNYSNIVAANARAQSHTRAQSDRWCAISSKSRSSAYL